MGVYIAAGIVVLLVLHAVVGEIYSRFVHTRWEKNAKPDENAEVVAVRCRAVVFVPGKAKFRSLVKYSDGFRYLTYKTDRVDYLMRNRYTISVIEQEIIAIADEAHWEALEKMELKGKCKLTKRRDNDEDNSIYVSKKKQQAVASQKWVCTCGREHSDFESSCVCGVTKAEAKRAQSEKVL